MNRSLTEDQTLNKLVRTLSQGEYLFQQGEMGNTMFLILEGTVQLFRRSNQKERLIWTLGAGETIGEKALLGQAPYLRTTTAQAQSGVVAIEFDAKNLKTIQAKFPDFTPKMIKILCERLDQANELITILQSTDETLRVVEYLLFFTNTHAKKTPQGMTVEITAEAIGHAVNCAPAQVSRVLDELTSRQLLTRQKTGYTIKDADQLQENINQVRRTLAAA